MQVYNAVFTSPGPSPGEYRVQLGAFRSLENANDLWQRVWRSEWDLLGRSEPRIRNLDLGAKGALHLLQIGALASERQAQALCGALRQRGLDCLVVRPSEKTATTDET
jgi:cell division septation protein DedD